MAADLSQFSTDDLKALQAGDLTKVSTDGLKLLQASGSSPSGSAPSQAAASPSVWDQVKQTTGNAVAGAVRGAGSIGATILAPYDMLQDALDGKGLSLNSNRQRRADMDAGLTTLGADPNSLAFKIGKVGGEIAGTSGVGGVLGNAARFVGAGPSVGTALSTAGLTTGSPVAQTLAGRAADLGLRSTAGAVTGAASTGLIDPQSAGTGAAVGAALPPALKAVGTVAVPVANFVGRTARNALMPSQLVGAKDIATALGAGDPAQQNALVQLLRAAPTLVPDASPTVAQALQTPQASLLQRVVYDSPGGARLRDKIAGQSSARTAALESVAPTNAAGLAQARADLGSSVESQMIPEQQRLSAQVRDMYQGVDPNGQIRLGVPLTDMRAGVDRYLGPGSFGQGNRAQQGLDAATSIGTTNGVPMPATWQNLQRLRSSMGDAWSDASSSGRTQEAAALNEMRRSLDARIDAAAAGNGRPGEVMPPEAAAAWREANQSYANLQQRFHTGPQAGIFRQGGDGQPAKQGGEIASAFWGNRPGLANDVDSFRRLIDDQPGLLGQFRSLITTHGAATADAGGNLTSKFSRWVDQSLPGLRGAFSAEDVSTLQRIAQDIDRSTAAQKLGTSLGGSNTYQNASNALNLGLLDNPLLARAAGAIPGVRAIAAPTLDWMRQNALMTKSARMANLLADSGASADALEQLMRTQSQPSTANALLNLVAPSVYRGAPRATLRQNQ